MTRGLAGIASASLWFVFAACGGDSASLAGPEGSTEAPDTTAGPAQVVRSIGMKPKQLYIDSLQVTRQTSARALAEDGSYLYSSVDYPDRFSWSSSSPNVLRVDPGGVATSEGWGVATLSAQHEGNLAGTMRVVVGEAVRPAWSRPVGPGTIHAGIAVGIDGTIYAGTNEPAADSSVWHALSPDGGILWSRRLPYALLAMPAIGDDGTLYFASSKPSEPIDSAGALTAVRADGTVRWVLEGLNGIRASPAIGPDGTTYVAGRRHVYAIDPLGTIRWSWEHEDPVFFLSAPAVADDGTVYVGGEDGFLYAIRPDGSLAWTFETEDRIRSSPAIGADGTIYFGSYDGRVYAVHPDGTERWSVAMLCGLPWGCQPIQSSPSIGPDGTIYVGVDALYAIDPGGSILWNSDPVGSVTTAVIGADGTVYFGSFRGITALDPLGRMLWHYPGVGHTASIIGSPAIGVDGTILSTSYSGSGATGFEGTVHAYVEADPTTGGYAGAAWPTGRGNRANTGRGGG